MILLSDSCLLLLFHVACLQLQNLYHQPVHQPQRQRTEMLGEMYGPVPGCECQTVLAVALKIEVIKGLRSSEWRYVCGG